MEINTISETRVLYGIGDKKGYRLFKKYIFMRMQPF